MIPMAFERVCGYLRLLAPRGLVVAGRHAARPMTVCFLSRIIAVFLPSFFRVVFESFSSRFRDCKVTVHLIL